MRTLEMCLDICSTDYICWWPFKTIQVTPYFLGIGLQTKSEILQVCLWLLSREAETSKYRKVLFSSHFVFFLEITTHTKIKNLIWLPVSYNIFWYWHSPLIHVLLSEFKKKKSNVLSIENCKMKSKPMEERVNQGHILEFLSLQAVFSLWSFCATDRVF